MSKEKGARRLGLALRAYPRGVRQTEGELLDSMARDMVDGGQSSINREALGLLGGGLAARAGTLAEAPWERALRRAGLLMAVALLSLSLGVLSFWMDGSAWPGWSWSLVVAAPALALLGLLWGRRLPLAAGAALICLLGVAQGNGKLLSVPLDANYAWTTGGLTLPVLACAIPIGLLLLATSLCPPRRMSRRTVLTSLAWVLAAAVMVRLTYNRYVVIGGVTVDGLALCLTGYGVAVFVAMVTGVARRRRDPAGMLTGMLGLATVLPGVLLYGISRIPLGDHLLLLLLALSAVATTVLPAWTVRFTPRLDP